MTREIKTIRLMRYLLNRLVLSELETSFDYQVLGQAMILSAMLLREAKQLTSPIEEVLES